MSRVKLKLKLNFNNLTFISLNSTSLLKIQHVSFENKNVSRYQNFHLHYPILMLNYWDLKGTKLCDRVLYSINFVLVPLLV